MEYCFIGLSLRKLGFMVTVSSRSPYSSLEARYDAEILRVGLSMIGRRIPEH